MAIGLSTTLVTNNGGGNGGAVYFTLQVADSPVTIASFESNTSVVAGVTSGYRVYTRLGSAQGSETLSGNWSLSALGTIDPNGTDNPSPVILDTPIALAANTLYGFAMIMPPTVSHRYFNGTCAASYTVDGNCAYSDANLTFIGGGANAPPFSATVFSPRIWSGTIFYHLGISGSLFPTEIEQILFHLAECGYFVLREFLLAVEDATYVRQILVRVEAAYDLTQLNSTVKIQWEEKLIQQDTVTQTVRPDSTTTTTYGDRSTKEFYYPSYQQRISAYHREVERLATALGIGYG